MEISVTEQSLTFLFSVLFGALLGFWYDFFRILRKSLPSHPVVVFVEDVFFWVVTTAATLMFLYMNNNGEIRVFILIGLFIGGVLYFLTLSRPIVFLTVKILTFLKKLILLIIKIILFPIRIILSPVIKLFKFIRGKIKKILRRIKRFLIFRTKSLKKFVKNKIKPVKTIE